MQINTIKSLQNIFDRIDYFYGDKAIKIWEMGTDFFLHLKRWNNISLYYKEETAKINDKEFDIKIKWNETNIEKKHGNFITYIKYDDKNYNYIDNLVFGGGEKNKEFLISNESTRKKDLGNSTLRQFFEFGISFGYISIDDKFKSGNEFTLIRINDAFDSDNFEECLLFAIKIIEKNWNLKNLKGVSIRDIAITILFGYYIFNEENMLNIEKIVSKNLVPFRNGEKRSAKEIEAFYNKKNSSLKKQTTLNNLYNEKSYEEIFNNLLLFTERKLLLNWEVDNKTITNNALEYEIKNSNRLKQPLYRLQLLNSLKRISKDSEYYNRHDFIENIFSSKLVEAAHILDYRYCNEDEKYDPDNGVLLDPSLHSYFDKDIVIITTSGEMLIKEGYEKEIRELFPWIVKDNKLNNMVLNKVTKDYFEKRILFHKINTDNYTRP